MVLACHPQTPAFVMLHVTPESVTLSTLHAIIDKSDIQSQFQGEDLT